MELLKTLYAADVTVLAARRIVGRVLGRSNRGEEHAGVGRVSGGVVGANVGTSAN